MAELILTDEEKAAQYWNDIDDAALGKAVKSMWFNHVWSMTAENDALDLAHKTATIGMCCRLHALNATDFECSVRGVHNGDLPCGDWRIVFERTDVKEGKQ